MNTKMLEKNSNERYKEESYISRDRIKFIRKTVLSSKIKEKIYDNINLRNNQNYMLSNNKKDNLLRVGGISRLNNIKEGELYFINNLELEKLDDIAYGERATIKFYLIFIVIYFSSFMHGWNLDVPFTIFTILFVIFIIGFYFYVFLYTKKEDIKKEFFYTKNDFSKEKIYFVRDVEGIYYYIK